MPLPPCIRPLVFARIARGSDCELHAVIPRNDVLRTLPRRLSQLAMEGILEGEMQAGGNA